jgi:hypothetical protein
MNNYNRIYDVYLNWRELSDKDTKTNIDKQGKEFIMILAAFN